ncbi:MAG: RNA pseudouridine synthase [Planctomycetota bacterium]|nr:MAG: RNA pseudouridine synthase [Planctomycetota bacterium]
MVIPKVPGEPPPDLSKPIERVRVRIYAELEGLRLDQALTKLFPWRTRSSIQRLIRSGQVHISPYPPLPDKQAAPAERARAARRVREDDILIVDVPPRAPDVEEFRPIDDESIGILWEDRCLVAIDKPAGLSVHPAGHRRGGTLINYLHGRYRNVEQPELDIVPRLCHRLDRETSGLILVAKDERAHSHVRKQFEAQSVDKSYLAIVEGRFAQEQCRVDAPLGPASRSAVRLKMAVREDGLPASTRFEVCERTQRFSLLRCYLETGRQHQIRVHLAHLGHPIVGDKLYGPNERYFLDALAGDLDEEARAQLRLDRQALHSSTLGLLHPESRERVELSSPLPKDLSAFLAADREG